MILLILLLKFNIMDNTWIQYQKALVCKNDDALLFDDLIACYKNSLFRPGYLQAWIMLVESLKRKIIELANFDDPRAKKEYAIIEQMENEHKSTDIQIYTSAKTCDIITDMEFTTVESLWKQRCLFAHPYMKSVTETDFRYIIEKLVTITLSKPLSFSKSMIEEYFKEVVNSPHIIPSDIIGQNNYIRNKILLIKEMHYPVLWKILFYHLSTLYADKKYNLAAFFKRFILILLKDKTVIDINDSKYTLEKQISKFPEICLLIFDNSLSWNKLNDKFKGDIFRYFKTLNKSQLDFHIKGFCNIIDQGENVLSEYKEIYYEKLGLYDPSSSYQYYPDKDILLNHIWEKYIKNGRFTEQAIFVDFLDSINSTIDTYFSIEQAGKIGRFLGICCINNTFKAHTFALNCKDSWINNASFCEELILQLLSNGSDLKIHANSFECFMNIIAAVTPEICDSVILKIEKIPISTVCYDTYDCGMIRKYFNLKKQNIKDVTVVGRINNIIDSYCKVV